MNILLCCILAALESPGLLEEGVGPHTEGVRGRVTSWRIYSICEAMGDAVALHSVAGVWVVANGKRVLNMASLNFLCIAGDPTIRVSALAIVSGGRMLLVPGTVSCMQY